MLPLSFAWHLLPSAAIRTCGVKEARMLWPAWIRLVHTRRRTRGARIAGRLYILSLSASALPKTALSNRPELTS